MTEEIKRHDFPLPEEDEAMLNASSFSWETITESNYRWVIIHDFPVPEQYNTPKADVAFMINPNYPSVQIDMFYVFPPLSLSGKVINATESKMTICSKSYQRWSRHRTDKNPWRPGLDNIYSQIMLVDEMLKREVKNESK